MGWSYGVIGEKEVGYGVEAACEHGACRKKIDRGLAYACGGEHGETEYSCDGYFCAKHLYYSKKARAFLCSKCFDVAEAAQE